VCGFSQNDCSLRCKGKFFNQKGIKVLEDTFAAHSVVDKKVIDAILKKANKDEELAIGCLSICEAKDIRDIICLVLQPKKTDQYNNKLFALFGYNKTTSDFSEELEMSCAKLFPDSMNAISKNYAALRKFLSSMSAKNKPS
jgi:hypothetical protein